jgi:hypothetical protein
MHESIEIILVFAGFGDPSRRLVGGRIRLLIQAFVEARIR